MLSIQDIVLLHLADVTFPQEHPRRGQTGVVNAFCVHHSSGLVLIDTGIGRDSEEVDRLYRPVRRRLVDVLDENHLRLLDVIAVINTHLHFDHCGQNALFPSVPIYVQAAEYAAAHQPNFTVIEWIDFPAASYRQLTSETEILDGIRVIPTPGHTPGHQSVVVETGEGPVIIAGQAVYSASEYEYLHRTGRLLVDNVPVGRGPHLASARLLVALRPRRVLFSHDAAFWESQS